MPRDRLLFETGLAGRDVSRLERALAGMPGVSVIEPATIVFEDVGIGGEFRDWVQSLVEFNRSIHETAKREGKPLRPYKPRDLVNLYAAVIFGLERGDPAAVVHEVIWRQPFPNANHRTVTVAFQKRTGLRATAEQVRNATEASFIESKRLLDGSDTSLTNEEAKTLHHAEMRRMCSALQSIK